MCWWFGNPIWSFWWVFPLIGLVFMVLMMFMMFRRGGMMGMCTPMGRDAGEDLRRQVDELKEEIERLKKQAREEVGHDDGKEERHGS